MNEKTYLAMLYHLKETLENNPKLRPVYADVRVHAQIFDMQREILEKEKGGTEYDKSGRTIFHSNSQDENPFL